MIPLRDLGNWSGGNTPSKENVAYWTDGRVPWVSPKDMKVDEITSSQDCITEAALADRRVSLIPEGSVLFVTRSGILAHTFPVAITKLPVTINQDLKALTPKFGISAKYVAHAVRGASRRILKQCSKHGTTVASVETNALLDFEIPVVDFDEQRRIVAEIEMQFSRLDEALANLQRVKANLKRYKAAVLKAAVEGRLVTTEAELARNGGRSYETGAQLLQRILEARRSKWKGKGKYKEPGAPDTTGLPELPEGWVWASVYSLSTKVADGVHKKPNYLPAGIPFVTVKNMTAGAGISFADLNYVSEEDHVEFCRRTNPERGDILISKDGTLGVVRVVDTDRPFSIFVSVSLVKPVTKELSDYLVVAFESPVLQRQMVPKGSGLQHIHLEDLRADCVPLPPLAEQERIVAEVDRRLSIAREVEAEVEANLKRAQGLRQAILQTAFAAVPPERQ